MPLRPGSPGTVPNPSVVNTNSTGAGSITAANAAAAKKAKKVSTPSSTPAAALYYPQPLFSSRITSLSWPMNSGSGVLTRGFLVWATAQTYYGGSRAAVNFLYNPTTIMHTNGLEMADVTTATVYRQPGDIATPLAPMNQVISFSLLFDRTFELWGSYGNNGNALNSGGEGAGSTLNDPTVMGVGADILSFKQITGEAAMAQQAQAASKDMSSPAAVMQGPMLLIPTWAFFGSISGGLYYYGFISEWDVTYTHFTQFMVPMRCAVDVSFNLLPLPSGAAGQAIQAGVSNAAWTTAQLGVTGTGNAAGKPVTSNNPGVAG